MSELLERLVRDAEESADRSKSWEAFDCSDVMREAAAELTRLQKEIETAREALEPFANRAGKLDGLWSENDTNWSPVYGAAVTIGDLRRAAAAYRALKDKEVGS